MGRPKGSKNKPKGVLSVCPPPPPPVPSVSPPSKRKMEKPTPKDTSSLPDPKRKITSAKTATPPTEDTNGQKKSSTKITIEGWVNLQKAPNTSFSKGNYYTGADVYPTIEDAKRASSQATVGQFHFACEVKGDLF